MNNLDLEKMNEFLRLPIPARDKMFRDDPGRHAEYMVLVHKRWDEYQLQWADKAWTKDPQTGMLKKTKGGMEHPFIKRTIVSFWPMPLEELKRLKRKSKPEPKQSQTPVEKVVEDLAEEMEIPF